MGAFYYAVFVLFLLFYTQNTKYLNGRSCWKKGKPRDFSDSSVMSDNIMLTKMVSNN